ncbi:MAG: hypothetical protein AB1403_01505 [Candidatus Riflebacteria bacterium]
MQMNEFINQNGNSNKNTLSIYILFAVCVFLLYNFFSPFALRSDAHDFIDSKLFANNLFISFPLSVLTYSIMAGIVFLRLAMLLVIWKAIFFISRLLNKEMSVKSFIYLTGPLIIASILVACAFGEFTFNNIKLPIGASQTPSENWFSLLKNLKVLISIILTALGLDICIKSFFLGDKLKDWQTRIFKYVFNFSIAGMLFIALTAFLPGDFNSLTDSENIFSSSFFKGVLYSWASKSALVSIILLLAINCLDTTPSKNFWQRISRSCATGLVLFIALFTSGLMRLQNVADQLYLTYPIASAVTIFQNGHNFFNEKVSEWLIGEEITSNNDFLRLNQYYQFTAGSNSAPDYLKKKVINRKIDRSLTAEQAKVLISFKRRFWVTSDETILEIKNDYNKFADELAHEHVNFLANAGEWYYLNKNWEKSAEVLETAIFKSLENKRLADEFMIKHRLKRLILSACEAHINSGNRLAATEFMNKISSFSIPSALIALGESGEWFHHQKDFETAKHSLGLVYEKWLKYLADQSIKESNSIIHDSDGFNERAMAKQIEIFLSLVDSEKRETDLEKLATSLPRPIYSSIGYYIKACQANDMQPPFISPVTFWGL